MHNLDNRLVPDYLTDLFSKTNAGMVMHDTRQGQFNSMPPKPYTNFGKTFFKWRRSGLEQLYAYN